VANNRKTVQNNCVTPRKRAECWLTDAYDETTRLEVMKILEKPDQLFAAFSKELSFGTGGLRELMGVGTNRINVYTIRTATQALANYIKKMGISSPTVLIGYDVRHNSVTYAEEAAKVLSHNQITTLLTKKSCPTPLISFGCRHYNCTAAIVITASHNPSTYNGYKVYWSDGGQIVSPHTEGIQAEINQAPILSIGPNGKIHFVGYELDDAYLSELTKWQLFPPSPIELIYTPLHGTGIRLIPKALQSMGYNDIEYVELQKPEDANFSNAPSPNPEDPTALKLGTEQLIQTGRDLLIATDPDADRIGVVALHRKKAVILTGNQIASLSLYHLCKTLSQRNQFPVRAACIKTIVTSELFRKIGESFGASCIEVLTGFKYIAEQITQWEQGPNQPTYLFGAEESCGYLYGNLARDKDAISAACLIAEMGAQAKKEDKTLVDRLYDLYSLFGIHCERLVTLPFNKSPMTSLRNNPPTSVGGITVNSIQDYLKEGLNLPKSDVLRFWLDDGSKLVIRPSGTEPKIKIYAETFLINSQNLNEDILNCDQKTHHLTEELKLLL
jgi:phosphomannomutase